MTTFLYAKCSCGPGHFWHQHFCFFTTLTRSAWLFFKLVSKQFWMSLRIKCFGFGHEGGRDRGSRHTNVSKVTHSKSRFRFSDLARQEWKLCLFFGPALIFHHLPASVPAPNEISCVGCRALWPMPDGPWVKIKLEKVSSGLDKCLHCCRGFHP